ncbi:MAG: hypothetical protein JXA68_10590 [Ignavibacteriales bacterium]|nr:hypothetical protein [Ignavibacteriales bacterium]
MDYSDKIILDYLKEILNIIKGSNIKDYILIILGGIIGLFSSLLVFKLTAKTKYNETLMNLLIDISILTEEIRHNAFAIREEGYKYKYFMKEAELKNSIGESIDNYSGIILKTSDIIDIRLKDRELLSAKLSGLIEKHNLLVKRNIEIDSKFKDYAGYEILPDYFNNINNLEDLKKSWDPQFIKSIKDDLSSNFEPVLFSLINEIKSSIYKKLNKKSLIQ